MATLAVVLVAALVVAGCDMITPDSGILANEAHVCLPGQASSTAQDAVNRTRAGGGDACFVEPPEGDGVPNFGGSGSGMVAPIRIAQTASGWLLVTDSRAQAVYRVNPETLQPDQSFPVDGWPHAVGMLGSRIYVGNLTTKSVDVFDNTGARVGSLGSPGSLERPTDLAVDSLTGWVFVLDNRAGDVKIFESAGGTLVGTIGSFVNPSGIALRPNAREVVVTDAGPGGAGGRMYAVVVDYDGTLIRSLTIGRCSAFSCRGTASPMSVEVDDTGALYVLDLMVGGVVVHDRASTAVPALPIYTIGGRTGTVDDLAFPLDLVVAGADIFVTSKRSGRIDVFRGVIQ